MFRLDLEDTTFRRLGVGQRQRALALAEAILPGSHTIRPADERTLRVLEQVTERISPWATRAFSGAVDLLDRGAVVSEGKPFHKLSREAQDRCLHRWETDPVFHVPLGLVSFALKFTHFDTQDVYERMGGQLNVVQNQESPRWLSQIVDAKDWDVDEEIECEVVVVGTGAGGAVVGAELAERGHAVVLVEEGGHHRRDAFTGSSLQAHFDYYRGALAVGNAPMAIFMGKMVGGSTAVNTGSCFRTPSWVLDRWCEDIGTDEFTNERMAPHFQKVERILEVELANEKAVGPIGDIMSRGCDALGWAHQRMLRNAPGCEGAGFCDFGCRTDARKSTNLSYVPRALERGGMLFTGLKADEILIEGGRARGIRGTDTAGRRVVVRAERVVFSGGAIPTPLFLLKQGIANSSDQVGRNLTMHPSSGMTAVMEERTDPHKHIPQGYFVEEHLEDGILINAAQPDRNFLPIIFVQTGQRLMQALEKRDHLAHLGVLISDQTTGTVRMGPGNVPLVHYNLNGDDVARMHRGMVHAGEIAFAAGAKELYPVCVRMGHVRSRDEWARFKSIDVKASDLMLTSYHPLGSCKVGRDPKTSVVGLDHQCHDVPGLYIVDGSTVPGPIGVNPQITIMAMATRAAGHIAESLS